MGRQKAAVLPEPVTAEPHTSFPASTTGMTAVWGEGGRGGEWWPVGWVWVWVLGDGPLGRPLLVVSVRCRSCMDARTHAWTTVSTPRRQAGAGADPPPSPPLPPPLRRVNPIIIIITANLIAPN